MKERIIQEFITKLADKLCAENPDIAFDIGTGKPVPNASLTICLDSGYNVIEGRETDSFIADRDTLWELINFAFDGEFGDHNEMIAQLELENEELKLQAQLAEIRATSIENAQKFLKRLLVEENKILKEKIESLENLV